MEEDQSLKRNTRDENLKALVISQLLVSLAMNSFDYLEQLSLCTKPHYVHVMSHTGPYCCCCCCILFQPLQTQPLHATRQEENLLRSGHETP